jgi:uncharacterized membrane protein YGL010W
MRNIEEHLTQYAAYHRDQRNIATHFVGVPLIVFSVVLALAQINIGSVHVGWVAILAASTYYIWLDRTLGVSMLILLAVSGVLASLISMQTGVTAALIIALALFVVGWIFQFVGHKYEGMKPAFVDDLMGLAIGPLFVLAEAFFMLSLKRELRRYIEDRVGPTMRERNGKTIGPIVTNVNANTSTPNHI